MTKIKDIGGPKVSPTGEIASPSKAEPKAASEAGAQPPSSGWSPKRKAPALQPAREEKKGPEVGSEIVKPAGADGTPSARDLVDPLPAIAQRNAEGKSNFEVRRFTGPVFKGPPTPKGAVQGHLGDCYLPGAMAAIAQANPEAIRKMIKDNGDGTYTVTFKEKALGGLIYKNVKITVDTDFYAFPSGMPFYGGAEKDGTPMSELWFPLVEKAYAQMKGSYDEIGKGGFPSNVMEAVLGKPATWSLISLAPPEQNWASIKSAIDEHRPITASTFHDDAQAMYPNSGIHADHVYSVLGYSERDGQQYVKMRNPWGDTEPGSDGVNDGIFELPLADLQKYFQSLGYVEK